jgi:hypothetical protein
MECGSEASAHAEANASALQTGQRAAPLSHAVGEGLGVRAESGRTLHTVNPSDVPLSAALSPLTRGGEGRGELKGVGFLQAYLLAALPSSTSLPPCERDARAPSTRDAGNAGVLPAMPTVREKTYPFEVGVRGDSSPVHSRTLAAQLV